MFKRPSVHYGRTPEPVTPYQKAAQIWDERIGSARVQARNWRLMAFGCLLLSGGLAASLVWQSTKGTITPWVVEVDHLGQAQAVRPQVIGQALAEIQREPEVAAALFALLDIQATLKSPGKTILASSDSAGLLLNS